MPESGRALGRLQYVAFAILLILCIYRVPCAFAQDTTPTISSLETTASSMVTTSSITQTTSTSTTGFDAPSTTTRPGSADKVATTPIAADYSKQSVSLTDTTESLARQLPTGATCEVEQDDGQWTMPSKTYSFTRFSSLDEITTGNVGKMQPVWTFSTGVNKGHEAPPLVVGSTMYVVTPYPNVLYALDLKSSGSIIWKYEPEPASAAQGVACCDVVNRGCFYKDGRIFMNTLDGHTIGVDAKTGQELWKTHIADINIGETITMAPLVVHDHVLVGNSGGEFGVRGWVTALNTKDGSVAWRAYSTGPDKDCLIGPNFKPYYDMDKGKDLGVSSWPPDRWQIGGGTVWGWLSYDPQLNLFYYGTGNPGAWNPELRPGDNKWSCGVFARNPDTGEARWYYQWSPHDLFDHDGVNENMLVQIPIQGKLQNVILTAQRNGYVYVMDRATGQVFSATPFVRITSSKGVDLTTGRLIENPEKEPKTGKVVRDIAPVSPGAKDWQPCSFSPRTGLMYIPHQNLSMDYEGTEANYIAGTPYLGVNEKMYPGPEGYRGEMCAWDPVHKRKNWAIPEDFPVWSGTVVTAGDVVFYGTMEGWFKAVDARNGSLLWKFKCGSGIIGQPITYRGPDGKQYVSVMSGVGGWAGAIVSGDLDARDPTAALGFVNAMKDLPAKTVKGGMVYVFALP